MEYVAPTTSGSGRTSSMVSSSQWGPARLPVRRQIRTFSTSDGIRYQSGSRSGRGGHEPAHAGAATVPRILDA